MVYLGGFFFYEIMGVLVLVVSLIAARKLNWYHLLFILMFFLLTYWVVPYVDVKLVTHRYIIRAISTILSGATTYIVYRIDCHRRRDQA